MSVISMKQLLEAGVHFGHQTRRWNPKMAPYIYMVMPGLIDHVAERNRAAIINALEIFPKTRAFVIKSSSLSAIATASQRIEKNVTARNI